MNSLSEEQVFAAIVGAIIGLLIGFYFGRRSAPGSEENRELRQQLEDAQNARERYEQRVDAHFTSAASKLNALTENYRDIYAHLASGAAELCTQGKAAEFNALAAPQSDESAAIESDSVMVEAPRDYAPKASPDDPGVLNERFGLEGEDTPPTETSARQRSE